MKDKIIFHVHLPANIEKLGGCPVVIGDGNELGEWENNTVKLHRPNSRINPTYWRSEETKLTLSENSKIKYNYAIYIPAMPLIRSKKIIYEGNNSSDEIGKRLLNLRLKHQFDIWMNGNCSELEKYQISEDIPDYAFVDYVYDHVSTQNLKESVLEYRELLTRHENLTIKFSGYEYVIRNFREELQKEQKIFLCLLLGYHISRQDSFILPENFKSELFFNAFMEYRKNLLPSKVHEFMLKAILCLIKHNGFHYKFDWLIIFGIAQEIDPTYSFLEILKDLNYSCSDFRKFSEEMKKIEYCTNDIKYKNTIKIAKWLSKLCNNIESLIEAWNNPLILNEQVNNQILQCFTERIQEIISDDDIDTLMSRSQQLQAFRGCVSVAVRNQALSLIEDPTREWSHSKYAHGILKLFQDDRLNWSSDDIITFLEIISQSHHLDLLNIFPNLLDYWFNQGFSDSRILNISKNWFTQFLDTEDGTEFGEIFVMLLKLDSINPLLGCRENIWENLTNIVADKMKAYTEFQIMNVIKFEPQLKTQEVKELFLDIIKEILDETIQQINDQLIDKILMICGCEGESSLVIPNEICEDIVCYIITRIQDQLLPESDDSEQYLNVIQSIRYNKFLFLILKATGNVEQLYENSCIQSLQKSIIRLNEALLNKMINIQLLQQLLENSDEKLSQHFHDTISRRLTLIVSRNEIAEIRKMYQNYKYQLDQLLRFYSEFCSESKVTDVNDYIHDIQQRMENLNEMKLNQILLPDHWTIHKETLDSERHVYKLIQSQSIQNIFEDHFQKDSDAINVNYITQKLLPIVFENYNNICIKYEEWEGISYSDASKFWKNVKNINAEFDLTEELARRKNPILIQTLEYLLKFPQWVERLERLERFVKIFQIEYNESELSESICTMKSDSLMLGQVIQLIKNIEENFFNNEDYWSLIKELSNDEDLIKNVSKHNIKNLLNVIDDYPDGNLVQYITILSFAQVKQILLPLIDSTMNIGDFIQELSTIIEKNSALSDNITLCNSNNMVLQNMHNKIINLERDIKENVKDAINNGTYIFVRGEKKDECTVTLKLAKVMYDLNYILDLHKKALLNNTDRMNDFTDLVDIIQKIIEILTKLMQGGHFDYQKSEPKIKEIKGMKSMKKWLITTLNNDLERWNNMKNQAQENCYHLTFFTAHHIFAFYNYFTSKVIDEKNRDVCKMLVKFVNGNAKLPSHKKLKELSCDSYDYFSEIGDELENIFRNVSKQRRKINMIQQEVIINDVTSDRSFVVAYDNKLLVPNIIMSLYVNNGYYPEPWQLLLCSSSTTMGELLTFIKRCVFASNNGYNNYLFCIVNLELLNFELQYHLVDYIKEMQLNNLNKNYSLSLLCYQELGTSHYIIDQHSLDVRKINGLNNEMMQEIYRELCPNVLCVTSDLSGQGKTEWIKESSFSKDKIPHSFLISDDMSFEYLVNKLKDCEFKDKESIHINMLPLDHPESVNLFLFKLLTFKIVTYKDLIVSIPETFIYIEIASSIKQNYLPMLGFLPSKHLSWNFEKFKASQEKSSPIQVVCSYLNLYDYGEIDGGVLFNISDVVKNPLPAVFCRNLIMRYFFKSNKNNKNILSFRNIGIFVEVLADQLTRLSSNYYFTINNLENLKDSVDIKPITIKSLIDISKDHATKFIKTKADQLESMNDCLDIISQWDNNIGRSAIIFNSQVSNFLKTLYQDEREASNIVKLLLRSQITNDTMSVDKLYMESMQESSEYALSVDNLIKMGLILLRVHANIPVIICGETGCGKTSLIIYLALISKVQYKVLNLQERIEEETIMKSISEALKKSEEGEFWILFDEINASNHLNLLADLISNRIFRNEPIHPNIRLFATCNPYRICDKLPNNTQYVKKYKERSNLIYQVKPIPNQILDYVWDYGVLKPEDEYEYIQVMVKNELKGLTQPVLVELIFASQKFIRKIEEPYSVSLRDVKRVIRLIKFFYNSLNNRPTYKKGHKYPSDGNLVLINRSYVLALSICYHSRLCEQDLRKQYRYEMGQIFQTHEIFMEEEIFIKIVNEEQEDYINRMQIPNNIIKNEALLENILAIIVCILTKIPIFVIGETGSSKSLALHLISSNLRGLESNNDYFKSLPKVHVVSYLYSSNFTSDGITKIFEKANEYQENNPNIINVVLLDNVGSNSLNSLKLLHTLLEPIYPKTEPTVSFVGLSNWQLDISKSSRSILVQRPKHDLNDLVNINNKIIKFNKEETSEFLAKAYLEYKQHNQALPNFYGLRDYYALLKMLSSSKLTPENIKMALARNFGGIENNVRLYDLWNKYFGNFIKTFTDNSSWLYEQIPITRLIESNLSDSNSRNLMVIGKSETIVNLLTDQLKSKDPIVILGSHFPDDQDDYSFKVLNKIMTCIGTGRPLILTNLERIYAVLYNLWSQNNIVIRNKENTEQDTYNEGSNFMRHISLKCECVVVLDEKNLCSADPSLLNRFEKQKLSIGDYLNEKQQSFVQRLNDWTERISTFEVGSYKFVQKDLFIGFDNDETLQSLVLDITNNYDYDDNEIIENCKRKLVALTTSDGILRAERLNVDSGEINRLKYIYFNQHRDNIYDYFVTLFNRENSLTNSKDDLIIINTFSHVNSDVMSCLRDPITSQAYKLSHLKSEAQLSNIVENFYLKSNYQILILQCDKAVSIECINLAKFIIEKFKNENLDKEQQVKTSTHIKCVCIINHIQRGSEQNLILSNFIHGWKQITIESLEQQNISLSHLLGKSIYDIVNSELFSKIVGSSTPFEKTLEDGLLWCLSCIKYQVSDENCNNYISTLSKGILDNANFVLCMKEKTYKWIFENYNDWQFEIAKNRDYSNEFSCFSLALQNYVKMIIKQIIARILYLLENLSATKTYFTFEKIDDNEMKTDLSDLWKQCFMDNTIINIGNLPEPKPSKYIMSYSVIDELEFPFSYYFFDQINFYKIYYNEELDILRQDLNNIDEETKELHIETIKDHTEGFKNKLLSIKSNFKILQKYSGIYYKDFIKILSNTIEKYESVKELDFIFRNIIEDEVISNPFLLHIYWWRHAESILIQLQLFENFPTIYTKAQKDFHGTLEIFLFNEAIDLILQKIYNNEEYEKEIEIIFSLIIRVNYAKNLTNLPLLYICNELLKIKLIPLEKIKEMIDLGKATEKQEFITVEIIDLVFNILDNNNDLILTNIRSSIMKSLEIIPFKSEVRLILYKNLFSRKPFNLINEIIEKIFIDENQQNDGIFFTLINNPNEALQNSTGLNVINDCLDIENLDTNIGELCCEIIQSIFSKFELKKLIPCFNSIVENAKEDKENSALQQITVISFLKEFIIKTWEYFIHEKNLLSESLIKEINDFFETKHLLALSFKSYFLLQQKRFSINTDQYKIIANIFPWIENVENDTNEEIIYPKFWRIIKQVTIEELRIFYNNNSNLNNYPLLLVYFNHYEKLKLIKHLYPIMKFVKILNSKLEYQNSKRSAQNMTFNEFIKEESEDNTANGNYLRSLFEGFASSWNSVINYIDIDQSKEFSNKPFMNLECSVIYGLVEHKDEGIYLCAILKFLIDMHNELLDNVFSIPVKFPGYLSCNDPAYFTKSIMITQAQEISFVNYKLDEKILKYSRRNLDKIDEISFDFDLQQVEMLLMKELVNNKVYFKQGNNNEFSFRHEIFYNSPRIFFDIRKVLQQEPIKTDKIKLFLAALQRSNSFISELLLFFEIILSFIKKLAIDNNEMLIKDFIQQWLKLSRYNIELTEICEEFSEFSLKHIIELYELIEEHDANSIEAIMYKIGDKFKIPLEEHMKESINDCIDYYNQSELLISAEAFALALKRFIYRYLLIDSNNIENLNLTKYFWNFTLNLWPNYIEEELVKKLFPDCLLVSHAYSSYIYIADKIKTTKEKQEKEKKASFNFKLTRK